jgi:hypothetical protein
MRRLALVALVALACVGEDTREDPTGRVWTDREKSISCWYKNPHTSVFPSSRQEIECVPIMEEGGYR